MQEMNKTIQRFDGQSTIKNKNNTMASDMQNFEVRELSLRVRNGSVVKIGASGATPESLLLLKTKAGVKSFLGAEGANLWKANSGMSEWSTPAIKTDCNNAIFNGTSYMNKIYIGNGVDRLSYDGTTLTSLTSAPLFTFIDTFKNRLWCNHLSEPTFLYRNEFDNNGVPTDLDTSHYIQISEDNGDGIKGIIKSMTHLLILNEFSSYAIYGSSNDDFAKVMVGPIGSVNYRSITSINEMIYWLSWDGVYSYSGGNIYPISFTLGELSDIINTSRLAYSCAIGYKGYYWLAIAAKGSTSNDMVLLYDTIRKQWCTMRFPFSINSFCLDGNILYCTTSDKKIYQLNIGTTDGGSAINAIWTSDPLDFDLPGRKKKIKNIAIEISEVVAGGTINLYLKEDDGNFSAAYPYTIPTASPGKTVTMDVDTKKFYNLTVKLETTAAVTINKISFGGKYKTKVK